MKPTELGSKVKLSDGIPLGKRDAVHAPCVLVQVSGTGILKAGDPIQFADPQLTVVKKCASSTKDGIVDPFLKAPVTQGELFWVLLIPGATSNLTHTFDITLNGEVYPFFEESSSTAESSDNVDKITAAVKKALEDQGLMIAEDDGCSGCY